VAVYSAERTNLDANTHQGYFAEGFVTSIATAAGLDVSFPRLGHAFDLQIFRPGPRGTTGSKTISLQVKSWSTGALNSDGTYHYPLEVPAYNFLAGKDHDVRQYLILCMMPSEVTDYADAQHSRLRLQTAAYWLSLRDSESDFSLNDQSRKMVHVPRAHLLTPATLLALVAGKDHLAVVE
jgi:hypothetical protein